MPRFSPELNAMDIMPMDLEYWLGISASLYYQHEKGMPKVIRVPMIETVPHAMAEGGVVKVEFLLPTSEFVGEITADTKDIPRASVEEQEEADRQDDERKEMLAEIKRLSAENEERTEVISQLVEKLESSPDPNAWRTGDEEVRQEPEEEEEPEIPEREQAKEALTIPVGTEMVTPEGVTFRLTAENGWQEVVAYVPDDPRSTVGRPGRDKAAGRASKKTTPQDSQSDASQGGSRAARAAAARQRAQEEAAQPKVVENVVAPGQPLPGSGGVRNQDLATAKKAMRNDPDIGGDVEAAPSGGEAGSDVGGGTAGDFLAAKAVVEEASNG